MLPTHERTHTAGDRTTPATPAPLQLATRQNRLLAALSLAPAAPWSNRALWLRCGSRCVWLAATGETYRPECSCGWQAARTYTARATAQRAAIKHVQECRTGRTIDLSPAGADAGPECIDCAEVAAGTSRSCWMHG